jgi:hypothetical protein
MFFFFFCFFWVEGSATVRGARGREGELADEMRLFSGAAAARRSSLRALSFLGSCAADEKNEATQNGQKVRLFMRLKCRRFFSSYTIPVFKFGKVSGRSMVEFGRDLRELGFG